MYSRECGKTTMRYVMKKQIWYCIVAMLGLVWTTGCVPIAGVTPPVGVSIGTGAVIGKPLAAKVRSKRAKEPRLQVRTSTAMVSLPADISIGFRPLQLIPSMYERSFGIAAGVRILMENEFFDTLTAPYIEGTWFFGRHDFQPREQKLGFFSGKSPFSFRWGLRLRALAPIVQMPNEPMAVGWGGSVRLTAEFTSFGGGSAIPFCSGGRAGFFCGLGTTWGEFSMGGYVETSVLRISSQTYWIVSVGLVLHLPSLAGLGFAVLFPK